MILQQLVSRLAWTVERAQTPGNLPITLGQLLIYCRTATGGGDNDRARKLVEDIKRRYVANGFPVQETTGVSYLEMKRVLRTATALYKEAVFYAHIEPWTRRIGVHGPFPR